MSRKKICPLCSGPLKKRFVDPVWNYECDKCNRAFSEESMKNPEAIRKMDKKARDFVNALMLNAGAATQRCAKCGKHFIPLEEGGTFGLDEGWCCHNCLIPIPSKDGKKC